LFVDPFDGCKFLAFQRLNRCQSDILRLLAEDGACSIYDLAKRLEYKYPHIYKNTKKLKSMELIEFRKDSTGIRVKKLVELNFRGMILFLLMLGASAETRKSVRSAVTRHPELLPFSRQWKEIEESVGAESVQKELLHTAWDVAHGSYVKLKIDHLNLKFPAFIYGFVGPVFHPPKTDFQGKRRNLKVAHLLASHDDLKKAYISFLAIQDILDLAEGILNIDDLTKFRSERELAFFEKRDLRANPLFPKERLREIFPKYAEMKYVFTGSLMSRLLWGTLKKPTVGEKRGFRVCFSDDRS
jgi:DNA-binding PadR family transcriptional regulator